MTDQMFGVVTIVGKDQQTGSMLVYLKLDTQEDERRGRPMKTNFLPDGTIDRTSDRIRQQLASAYNIMHTHDELIRAIIEELPCEIESRFSSIAVNLGVRIECRYFSCDYDYHVTMIDKSGRINKLTQEEIYDLFNG